MTSPNHPILSRLQQEICDRTTHDTDQLLVYFQWRDLLSNDKVKQLNKEDSCLAKMHTILEILKTRGEEHYILQIVIAGLRHANLNQLAAKIESELVMEKVQDSEKKLAEAIQKQKTLQQQKGQLAKEIIELGSQVGQLRVEKTSKEASKDSLLAIVDRLSNEVNQINQQVEELKQRNERLGNENTELESTLKTNESMNAQLHTDVNACDSARVRLEQLMQQCQQETLTLETQMVQLCHSNALNNFKREQNGTIHIFGGHIGGQGSAQVRTYAVDKGCTVTQTSMTMDRQQHCVVFCKALNKLVIIGGDTIYSRNAVECCSVSHDAIMFMMFLKLQKTQRRRRASTAVCIGKKVYVMGGMIADTCEYMDLDEGVWKYTDALPHKPFGSCSIVYQAHATAEQTILLIGGSLVDDNTCVNSIYEYFPSWDRWRERADLALPITLYQSAAVIWDRRVVLLGGAKERGPNQVTNECYMLDESSGKWDSLPPMNTTRCGHMAVVVGGRIVVMGGMDKDGKRLKSVEVFDGQKWTTGKDLDTAICYSAAVVI